MSNIVLISYLVLWAGVICLFFGFLILVKKGNALSEQVRKGLNPNMPIGLVGTDEGLSKHFAFPVNMKASVAGDLPSFVKEQGSIILFSLGGCKTCHELYPILMQFSLDHPKVPIFIILFSPHFQEIEETISKYQLNLPVIPYSTDDIPFFQTRLFPFGYALDREGIIVGKGNMFDRKQLELLMDTIAENTTEFARAV